jgi:peptidoglycan/xylan/chitin deacetylase (PgdA/CDA1 family)
VIRRLVQKVGRIAPLPVGAVLLYHRVVDVTTDPQLLAVSPRNFADHLDVLRRSYTPARLGELRSRTLLSVAGRHPIAVTFDDGYADNVLQALPLLQAAAVPATVFVVAGHVGQLEEFWWDELERILLGLPALPEFLEVELNSRRHRWVIPSRTATARPDWHVLSEQIPSPRQIAYSDLCSLLRPVDSETRNRILTQLRTWAGVTTSGRSENRALAPDELAALAGDGLIDVGAHSMTHPLLAPLAVSTQKFEIEASKRRLEDLVSRPVGLFAYPFGGDDAYTGATKGLVREAGYTMACSGIPGLVDVTVDPYEIPRIIVRNWSGDEFGRRMHAIFDG